MNIELMYQGFEQGLILALVSFGMMIPFRYLDFPDLSVEGAFPLGGAIYAVAVLSGFSPMSSIGLAMTGAAMLALCVSMVTCYLKVNSLLAGIILSTMAYSVNLRLMGQPSLALFGLDNLLVINLIYLFIAVLLIKLLFYLLMYTDEGLKIRLVGYNKVVAQSSGINMTFYTCVGLLMSGLLFGLSGSLMVSFQGFMDIGMGFGMVIHGLTSLMLGEIIIKKRSFVSSLIAPLVGALIYQQILGFTVSMGLMPSDLKFFTGLLILSVIFFNKEHTYAY